ncbi:hypothetical protein GCM10009613_14970 [Pseudonocardia kongjuensis]|uniref:Carrier domain-containing protein n=1 Tax=Pseudonocardia kongjuensis TaxID=102227 RepID=A0ABN1XKT8_9PSEU
MTVEQITAEIEQFVCESFAIRADDPGFHRDVDVFEAGYVDSVGLVEILAFVDSRFAVEIAEDDLLSEEFSTLSGMGRIVHRTRAGLTAGPAPASTRA